MAAKIIKHRERLFKEPIDDIVWVYGEWQELYEKLQIEEPSIKFTQDKDDALQVLESDSKCLIILDDRTVETLANNSDLLAYFVQKSHHRAAVFLWLTHAIFLPKCRLAQINATYCIVLRMLRDSSAIFRLGYQLLPTNPKFIYEAYRYAVNKKPYSYILFCFHPTDPVGTRIRTSAFFWEDDFELIRPKNGVGDETF